MNTLVISGLLELITNLNSKREATQTRGTETEFTETIKEVVYEITDFLDNPKSNCRKLVDVGGFLDCRGCSATCDKNNRENESCNRCTEDGNKALCLDSEVAPNPRKCIVLSFGIGNDFSFDDQMMSKLMSTKSGVYKCAAFPHRFGCQVYSFDFSMTNWTHRSYGPNRHFLSLGLSHSNIKGINFTYEHEGENRAISTSMLTLNSILDVLDIRDREISYLKMDIENAEWKVLQQVLKTSPSVLDRVLQLSLEVHLEDLLKLEREPEDTMPKIQRIRHVLKGLQVRYAFCLVLF
ncbi:uncharacterized protein LOC135217676 [Macrobrachium nipponense]|uniref:uncharacterized protein LOC135217676 n=1 Tax=Macrobrachium nipponense TaxID=159736 RepID=UPI0030C86BDC